MIRKAVPDDIPAIVELGLEALRKDAIPGLVISKERCFQMARECVSSSQHFAWVSERGGIVVAAVLALIHPNMFYERNCATVVQFYTRVPGDGVALIREFLRWARSRPIVKVIQFTLEENADPRIGKLLSRLGLKLGMPVYFETR